MNLTPRSLIASLMALTILSVGAVGCSSKKKSSDVLSPGQAAAAVASSSGAFPGFPGATGPASQLPPNAQFTGPVVEVTTPARGEYVTGTQVNLAGKVTGSNGKGVAEVHVNGMTVNVAADGKIAESLSLTPGLNTIVIEAWDNDQNRTERHVSVICGSYSQEDEELAQAGAVRLTDGALDLLEPSLAKMVADQEPTIRAQVMGVNPGKDAKITSFDFGAVTSDLDAVPGGVRFQVKVADLAMGIRYDYKILFFIKKHKDGTVRAQELVLDGLARVDVQNGQLVTQVLNVTGTVNGFSVPDWAKDYQAQIRTMFTQAFATQAGTQLDKALAQAVQSTPTSGAITKTFAGHDIRADWRLTGIAFDDDGATASFAANVRAVSPSYGTETRVVRTGTALPTLGGAGSAAWNGALAVHQDSINQALHAAWRSGALDLRLDAKGFAALNPNSTFALDTSALIALAPDLSKLVKPGLPLEIELEGKLPPVATLDANTPYLAQLKLGALAVKVRVNDPVSGSSIQLVDAVYALNAEVGLLEQNGKILFDPLATRVDVHVDVVGNGLPGSEELMERMTASMAPQLFGSALGSLSGMSLPPAKGFTLSGLGFQGQPQTLVITGTVAPVAATPAP